MKTIFLNKCKLLYERSWHTFPLGGVDVRCTKIPSYIWLHVNGPYTRTCPADVQYVLINKWQEYMYIDKLIWATLKHFMLLLLMIQKLKELIYAFSKSRILLLCGLMRWKKRENVEETTVRSWTGNHYPATCRHWESNHVRSSGKRKFYPCTIQILNYHPITRVFRSFSEF